MTLFDTIDDGRRPPAADRMRLDGRADAAVWRRRTFTAAIAVLAALEAFSLAIWRMAGAVVPWDSKNHFYPMFRFLGDALRHGSDPALEPVSFRRATPPSRIRNP